MEVASSHQNFFSQTWGMFQPEIKICVLKQSIPFLNHDFIIEISIISNVFFAESGPVTAKRQHSCECFCHHSE